MTNAHYLRAEMEDNGHIFSSTTDAEIILHEIARAKADTLEEAIKLSLAKISGAFSLIFLT